MSLIKFTNVNKRYDKRSIGGVSNLNFELLRGDIMALIGPSGAGKTTTLKLLLNELEADSGEIFRSEDVRLSYISQNNNLDEEKTVFDFLEEGIRDFISDEEKRINQVRNILQTLELTNEIYQPIKNISGGQRQRVIVAKALVTNPTLVLMDEPFEHLDSTLRSKLIEDLFQIFRDKKISVFWITHEIKEALSYSNKIMVLNFGEIAQIGTPEDIYLRPNSFFVADFFEATTSLAGVLKRESDDELIIKIQDQDILFKRPVNFKAGDHGDVLVILRPENVLVTDEEDYHFTGKIISKKFLGAHYQVKIEFYEIYELDILAPNDRAYNIDSTLYFKLDTNKAHIIGEI